MKFSEAIDGILEAIRLLTKRVDRLERSMNIEPGGKGWIRP